MKQFVRIGSWLLVAVIAGGLCRRAAAVPSFSRQTGFPCSTCHTTPPELTAFGRQFKLNGYTLTGMKQIVAPAQGANSGLHLNQFLPLSAMFQISDTLTQKLQPGTANGDAEFPQQLSLFLSGAWGEHIGSFIQVTYAGSADHFSADNTDIRWANQGKVGDKPLVWGLDLNNNPTVEDLWNDTPAWGFPWVSSEAAPGPAASTLIEGGLAQDVAGIGAYGMLDNHLYADVTAYRSMHLGGAQPNNGSGFGINIAGAAPYWRLAWQQDSGPNSLEVGTFGIYVASYPNAVTGPRDIYRDAAVDVSYQRQLGTNSFSLYGDYIDEHANLDASFATVPLSSIIHNLHSYRATGTYHIGDRYAATFGVFGLTGTADPLLYPAGGVGGSANGSPNSGGYVVQGSYWPIQNVDLSLQYTGYWKFNGGSTNYSGDGRNASDNNTLYAVAWFIF